MHLYKISQNNPQNNHRNLGDIEFVSIAAFKNNGGRNMEQYPDDHGGDFGVIII